jgi:CRISPR-associated protein Csx14
MDLKVRIDPLNPGQFFACCGLLAMLEGAGINAASRFETSPDSARRAHFVVAANGGDVPTALDDLRQSTVDAAEKDVEVEPTIEPVAIRTATQFWRLDWWLTEFGDASTELKCWAGQVKSLALISELFHLVNPNAELESLFDFAVMTKAKFGIDPRSAWNALDFGYSPDKHGKDAATYPMVEALGCLGLQSFRPTVLKGRKVRYALWMQQLPCSVARLAAFMPWSGLDHRSYEFSIDKRGQSYKFFSFSKFLGEVNDD